jgi:serine/threonine protein kinase
MKTTLSQTQWQQLQSLFDRAEQMDSAEADALIASLHQDDALIAETLLAMLSAHRQWQQRTGAAIETLASAALPSAVGARLGAFTLAKEIGRGGMGTVYLGERADGQVQQQVALKVLHARSLDDNTRERFQREREILAAFDHPGIARLLDVGESEAGEPYYVMEYLRGLPIDAHCDQNRLGIRERLHLFRSICDAVQYAHGKLILHRDIKPSNVIVDAAGVPRLIDFGIAKPIHLLDAVSVEETATHQRYFSPVNAAPEQIRGESVSVACDVYQLGTLLHELLCGRPIFEWKGSSVSDLEHKISAITPDAPSTVAASATDEVIQARALSSRQALARAVSGDLDAIVQRAVRKEPQLRYASVEQLSQDIERHLHDQPVLGRRGNRAYRFSRFFKRNRRAIALTFTAAVALISFTALLSRQVLQTTQERDRAVAASKRAESVTEYLLDIFRSGDPAVAKRAEVPIGDALSRARRMLDSRLADEPLTHARVGATIADLHTSLGELELAETLNVQALKVLDSMPTTDPSELMQQMQRTAESLAGRAKYADAEAMLDRLRTLETSSPRNLEDSWSTRLLENRLAQRSSEQGGCEKAIALADAMSLIADRHARGYALAQMAVTSCPSPDDRHLQRSMEGLTDAVRIVERRLGKDDTLLIDLKRGLANDLRRLKRVDEARKIYFDILQQQERVFGASSRSVANTLMSIGMMQLTDGDAKTAEATMLRAHSNFSAIHGSIPHGDMAAVAYNLAVIYDYGGLDKGKALDWYAKAMEAGSLAFGPTSRNVGEFSTEYGTLLWRVGEHAKAEPLLRAAMKVIPVHTPNGLRACLSLAGVMAAGERWSEVARTVAVCESSDPTLLKDADFASELLRLRSGMTANLRG